MEPSEDKNSSKNGTGIGLENALPDRYRVEIFEEDGMVHVLLEIRSVR